MRTYVVQPGDSPASIASRDDMAGCPKCSRDLLEVNPHKPIVEYPNGFRTFESLVPGERIALPEKWFNGDLDMRPQAYFSALPYADGVTPSTLGDRAAGVLGDYATLDAASAAVEAMPQMDITTFSSSVDNASGLINKSVSEVSSNPTAAGYAKDTNASTEWAIQRNMELVTASESGDDAGAQAARVGIQDVLSTALGSARSALQAFYGNPPLAPSVPNPTTITSAAQAAVAAIASNPNYCVAVGQPGSSVNVAVHAFKMAWNDAQTPRVPINTSNYEQATADALARVLGSAPTACGARSVPTPILPVPVAVTPPQSNGMSTGEVVGVGLLGAGAVGAAIYLATRRRRS